MQGEDSHLTAWGCHLASVEYGKDPFLWAVGADAYEDIGGKDIASHGNNIADP